MPTCTPTRVSLLTGQLPSRHGAYSIGVTVDPFPRPTLADRLADAGYATALFGKTHFVKREDEPSHVAGIADPSPEFWHTFNGPYVGFQTIRTSRGHTINAIPDMHYRAFLEKQGVDNPEEFFPQMRPGYDHHACGPWDIPSELHDTAWVGGLTEEFVRTHADGEPWFCWASFQDPHEPFVCPREWYDKVDRSTLEAWPGPREGEFEAKPGFYARAAAGDWSEFNDGCGVPSSFYTPERDARAVDALQATLGMIAFVDDRVGAIMQALEQTGQARNTIVVYTTDHGEMHGHHGFWGKGLTAYDDCQRVPLLVWGPDRVQARGTVQALANLVDIPATVLSLVGLDVPPGMQGCDLTPVLRGEADSVRNATIVECHATEKVYQQTLVTDSHKLIVYRDSDEGELYDMHQDPDQLTNLWNNPDCAELQAELLLLFAQTQMRREGVQHPRTAFA
jgi:uncharacterized sulfatase